MSNFEDLCASFMTVDLVLNCENRRKMYQEILPYHYYVLSLVLKVAVYYFASQLLSYYYFLTPRNRLASCRFDLFAPTLVPLFLNGLYSSHQTKLFRFSSFFPQTYFKSITFYQRVVRLLSSKSASVIPVAFQVFFTEIHFTISCRWPCFDFHKTLQLVQLVQLVHFHPIPHVKLNSMVQDQSFPTPLINRLAYQWFYLSMDLHHIIFRCLGSPQMFH